MVVRLVAVTVDALSPGTLADFWARLLGWERRGDRVVGPVEVGFDLRFSPTTTAKTTQNHAHLDLTSTSAADQQAMVARVLELGGRDADVGQGADEPHVVLADPEGDELCVVEPGNSFLAGCGRVGALACDGSYAVGGFWSRALGWPLVWDEDPETAVQSPSGGPKISWGGTPPGPPPHRVRLALAASDAAAETERLVALGATVLDVGATVALADPDGCAFTLEPDPPAR